MAIFFPLRSASVWIGESFGTMMFSAALVCVGAALHGDDLEAELFCRSGDRRDVADVAEVDVAGGGGLHERRSVVEPRELDLVRRIVERAGHLRQFLAAVAAVVADGEGVLTPLGMAAAEPPALLSGPRVPSTRSAGGKDARHSEQHRGERASRKVCRT